MNKTVLIGAVIVVAAGLGYYQFSYKPAQDAAAAAAAAAAEEAKAAEAAAAKAAEEAAAKAAADAAAVEEAAKKAAEEAAAAANAAADTATGAATDAAAAFTGLLDPANFDADKISAAIDGTALAQPVKDTLKAAVTAAKANPALVQGAIDQVKAAMGL